MTRWPRRRIRFAAMVVASSLIVACAASSPVEQETTATTAPPPAISIAAPSTTEPNETPPMTTDHSPSASTPPATDSPPATETVAPCRRITDFDDGDAWFVVNDGVMGGRSNGVLEIGDSTMSFFGTVVTDGGGFTSVRSRLDGGEMAGTTRLSMRARADARVYGVTLEDNAEVGGRSVSHRADLDTSGAVDADGWTLTTLEYSELQPSIFGRAVEAPAFDPGTAREIGIIIADGVDGEFSLDVDWIDVCA